MNLREIMKFIESEYRVINHTPCEICGGDYMTEDIHLVLIDDVPYDICSCVCSNCGYEKVFEFSAPFIEIEGKGIKKVKKILN